MIVTAVPASARHTVHGIGLLFLYLLVLGIMLVISGLGSVASRRRRTPATAQVRGLERSAGAAIRIGSIMTAIGAVGYGLWWLASR